MPFPDWIIPTSGVTGILASLIVGFAKGFLWTRPQVERLVAKQDAYAEDIVRTKDAEIDRLNKERLEWKAMALESIGVLRGINPAMDSVVAGQAAIKGLLEALRNKAEAN